MSILPLRKSTKMKKRNDTDRLRELLGGNFSSFKFSGKGNWYNQPTEKDFPLRLLIVTVI